MQTVLDTTRHSRLLADADHVCQVAGIPPALLHKSAVGTLATDELDWMRRFRLHQADGRGLLLTGLHDPSPEQKMMAMCAAFLRNFIDARVMSVNTLIDALANSEPVDATVLLIPNFHVDLGKGRAFQTWKTQMLYDFLLARMGQGKVNVLYVRNLASMQADYGTMFGDHLLSYAVSEGQ